MFSHGNHTLLVRIPQEFDDSDATYERRHRKYEGFEKRQRLQEKDKLKYEHFKLRERIEELKSTDSAAFVLPETEGLGAEDSKRLILKAAEELEDRYTMLLRNERKGGPISKFSGKKGGKQLKPERAESESGSIRFRIRRGRQQAAPSQTEQMAEVSTEDAEMEDVELGLVRAEESVDVDVAGEETQYVEEDTLEPPDADFPTMNDEPNPPPQQRRVIIRRSRRHTSPVRNSARLVSPESSISHRPRRSDRFVPALVQEALKTQAIAEPNASRRVERRNALPFGALMPPMPDEYALPVWIVQGAWSMMASGDPAAE